MSSFSVKSQQGSFVLNLPQAEYSSNLDAKFDTQPSTVANNMVLKIDSTMRGLSFYEVEDGALVEATMDLDSTLTPAESLRISLLVQLVISTHLDTPITYIRSCNLERHFRFKAV